eukprot:jgi/Ulvmu1/7869/UM004_0100.1
MQSTCIEAARSTVDEAQKSVPCKIEVLEGACMQVTLRSPLHPLTPSRRSPDHGGLDGSLVDDRVTAVSTVCEVPCLDAQQPASTCDIHQAICSDDRGDCGLQQKVQEVLLENARLKEELAGRGGDDVMTQQLLHQLQAAMADKSKVVQENDELARENCDLRMLLAYWAGEDSYGTV